MFGGGGVKTCVTKASPNYTISSASFNKAYGVLRLQGSEHLGSRSLITDAGGWQLSRKWSNPRRNTERMEEAKKPRKPFQNQTGFHLNWYIRMSGRATDSTHRDDVMSISLPKQA